MTTETERYFAELSMNFDASRVDPNTPDKYGGTREEYQARIDACASRTVETTYGQIQELARVNSAKATPNP